MFDFFGPLAPKRETNSGLLDKLEKCSSYDRRMIKWRRALFKAMVLTILVPLVMYGEILPLNKIYLSIFLVYIVELFVTNDYTKNLSGKAEKTTKKLIQQLRKNL